MSLFTRILIVVAALLFFRPGAQGQQLFIAKNSSGGLNNGGLIFSFKSDGTAYTKLIDAANGSLLFKGMTQGPDGYLYGASNSGLGNDGYIFKMKANGSAFSIIKTFQSNVDNAASMNFKPLIVGDKMYGVSYYGGDNGRGTLFSMKLDGTALTVLFSFPAANGQPYGQLLDGNDGYFYGRIYGAQGIFRIRPDGTGFSVLHTFTTGGNTDGYGGAGDIVFGLDGFLYGVEIFGGTNETGNGNAGAIWRLSRDGTVYNYYSMGGANAATMGAESLGGLMAASNGNIYGVAKGGSNGNGMIFKITAGTSPQISKVVDFPTTFGMPSSTLTEYNGLLWGLGMQSNTGNGCVFSVSMPNQTLTKILDLNTTTGSWDRDAIVAVDASKAYQDLTFQPVSAHSLGDGPFNVTVTGPSGGSTIVITSSNTNVATVSGNTVTIVGTGTCTLTANAAANGSYFQATPVSQTLTVNKGSQTISFAAITGKKYGDAAFDPGATSSAALAVTYQSSDPSILSISGSAATIHKAGTVTLTAKQAGNASYLAATDATQQVTIGKATLNVTANAASRTYGASEPTFTLSYSGFIGSDNASVIDTKPVAEPDATALSWPGTYDITVSGGTDNNYSFNYSPGTLTITQATLTAKPNDVSREYGADNPAFTLSYTGFVNNEVPSDLNVMPIPDTDVLATATSPVGNYTIRAFGAQAGSDPRYTIVNGTGILTITKASQSIAFGSLDPKLVSDAPFQLQATASSGLDVTFTSSNTSVATVTGNTVTIVGAGSTNIVASQAGNGNYNAAADATQPLTVNKLTQTINFGALASKTYKDAAFTISAAASSGLPVHFTSSNNGVATVSGNTITITGAGTVTISAVQDGNATYKAATQEQTLVVNKASQTISFAAISDKALGDAFSITATSSSGLPVTITPSLNRATVSGSQVTLTSAGRITLKATQAGDANYLAAAPVERSFCVKPAKPVIRPSFTDTEAPVLTSSNASGNQWYVGGTSIAGATNQDLKVSKAGIYKVITTIDDCASEFSDDFAIVVTGIEESRHTEISLYPNPVMDHLTVSGLPAKAELQMTSALGIRQHFAVEVLNGLHVVHTAHLASGLYILQIYDNHSLKQIKFEKK
ncbi:T9SS type A sorting domain-containing protein [Fulvivirgaceae bacterium PWU4]|uniref:T9SS type A sorting domain-containing protein n=1 Tax=Chryseosolibacter histidini TaxID=2782349 RepID=A0AAP2GQ67_9BACT|nr:choice-of-anchor tandem repeat GloVer-containing protein [Chryseosolibacter histidini]MBT1699848.1 T9SS type A sorting domain-containing protein [Chryseosolibacter histidini]